MLQPLSDKQLETSLKQSRAERSEARNAAINNVVISLCKFSAVVFGILMFACVAIVIAWLINNSWISDKSIDAITLLATHVVAGVGGYLGALIKKSMK